MLLSNITTEKIVRKSMHIFIVFIPFFILTSDKQCDAYTNGDVTGNLCNIFCNSKNRNKEENIPRDHENFNTGVLYPLEGCPNSFHGGKDVVFPAIISGSNRVSKDFQVIKDLLRIDT